MKSCVQVIKSLESLFSSGHLTEKAYGKQKIYFLNQAKLPAPADGEIKELEQTIKNMNKEVLLFTKLSWVSFKGVLSVQTNCNSCYNK